MKLLRAPASSVSMTTSTEFVLNKSLPLKHLKVEDHNAKVRKSQVWPLWRVTRRLFLWMFLPLLLLRRMSLTNVRNFLLTKPVLLTGVPATKKLMNMTIFQWKLTWTVLEMPTTIKRIMNDTWMNADLEIFLRINLSISQMSKQEFASNWSFSTTNWSCLTTPIPMTLNTRAVATLILFIVSGQPNLIDSIHFMKRILTLSLFTENLHFKNSAAKGKTRQNATRDIAHNARNPFAENTRCIHGSNCTKAKLTRSPVMKSTTWECGSLSNTNPSSSSSMHTPLPKDILEALLFSKHAADSAAHQVNPSINATQKHMDHAALPNPRSSTLTPKTTLGISSSPLEHFSGLPLA